MISEYDIVISDHRLCVEAETWEDDAGYGWTGRGSEVKYDSRPFLGCVLWKVFLVRKDKVRKLPLEKLCQGLIRQIEQMIVKMETENNG